MAPEQNAQPSEGLTLTKLSIWLVRLIESSLLSVMFIDRVGCDYLVGGHLATLIVKFPVLLPGHTRDTE
jgi:hypothetical protein